MSTTSFRPYDGTPVATVADSTATEVDAAVSAAVEAAPMIKRVDPATRKSWLYAVAESLEKHADELASLADEETALGTARLTAETARAAGQLRFYADVAAEGAFLGVTIDGATATTPRLVRINQPLGPVAVFGASNFPFAFGVLGNDTASAMAAGCPVVVKAHPAHVYLSVRLAELAQEALRGAGAPEGTLSLVRGHRAGADLVRAAGVSAVAFTGSQAGGLALWGLANQRPTVIPVFAEMGTVNPVVVTSSAMPQFQEVAEGFVGSFTLGFGQFCTKPGLMLVPAGHDAARSVGDALERTSPRPLMLTRTIADSVSRGIEDLVVNGAHVVRIVPGPGEGWSAPAAVLSASALSLQPGSRLLEECFGAVALVVEYADEAELRSALAALPGSLAATVVASKESDESWIVDALSRTAGRVTVGDWPTGVAYSWAQHHGGPWPATSAPATTSVGAAALERFVRPTAYQSVPDAWLPAAGEAGNPWNVPRRIDGTLEPPLASRS